MSNKKSSNETMYLATMHLAKNLLKQGIITEKQYAEIDDKFTNMYAPSLSGLFTDIHLQSCCINGNIGY